MFLFACLACVLERVMATEMDQQVVNSKESNISTSSYAEKLKSDEKKKSQQSLPTSNSVQTTPPSTPNMNTAVANRRTPTSNGTTPNAWLQRSTEKGIFVVQSSLSFVAIVWSSKCIILQCTTFYFVSFIINSAFKQIHMQHTLISSFDENFDMFIGIVHHNFFLL